MIFNLAIPDQLYNGLILVVLITIVDLIHKDDDRSSLTFPLIKRYFNVKILLCENYILSNIIFNFLDNNYFLV